MKDELSPRGEKVPMAKEAVRTLALSKLELHCASHLIGIGIGTGSVSIETALQYPGSHIAAIEHNPVALRLLDENHQHFTCVNIDIFPGVAPTTIVEKADAIFMGGSSGHLIKLVDWSMRQLRPARRLVMTFILQEDFNTTLAHLDHLGVQGMDCLQLQVPSLTALGNGHYSKPNNPIFVIVCQKEGDHI